MASFPLPTPGTAGQPFQFATIPSNFGTPSKLFMKSTTAAYVYDGSSLIKVTDVNYPVLTVWGVAYLDGVIYVMEPDGTIHGSNIFDPLTWPAAKIIAAKSEGDAAIALVRHLVYIIALKEHSSEFFYDASQPAPGSPLLPMQNAFMEVGCAVGGSIAFSDNTVFFMSESLPKGRSISRMDGFDNKIISTIFIDRILNADDLTTVYAFTVKKNGHVFYVLTLKTSALTLVYDDVTKEWHRWTNYTLGSSANITITTVDGITTATTAAMNTLEDGDPISVTYGSAPEITETVNVTWISSTQFSFIAQGVVTGTSASYIPWVESYFPGIFYTRGTTQDLLLSETGANVFLFDELTFLDNGQPINLLVRTAIDDWGTMAQKRGNSLEWVGDIEPTTVLVRSNDIDYKAANWSQYRPIVVTEDRAQINGMGSFRRRAHDFRHTDNTALRGIALEYDFFVGSR